MAFQISVRVAIIRITAPLIEMTKSQERCSPRTSADWAQSALGQRNGIVSGMPICNSHDQIGLGLPNLDPGYLSNTQIYEGDQVPQPHSLHGLGTMQSEGPSSSDRARLPPWSPPAYHPSFMDKLGTSLFKRVRLVNKPPWIRWAPLILNSSRLWSFKVEDPSCPISSLRDLALTK